MVNTSEVRKTLLTRALEHDFAGYDPFDGLNSRVFAGSGLARFRLARLAWIQFFKRSPVNFRAIAGVPRMRNPKGVALFILGLLEEQGTAAPAALSLACELADWLLLTRCDGTLWGGSAWGYHFDWEARAFSVKAGKPNAITTCYVARSLLALGKAVGRQDYVSAAVEAGYFMDTHLLAEQDGAVYFRYIPGEPTLVHNANLWVSAVVGSVAREAGDERLVERALVAARTSAAMQREDGSWAYGTRGHHRFVDCFHTGYNLEALDIIDSCLARGEFEQVRRTGMEYFRNAFFESNGAVKYYSDRLWPIDTHSVAQALITLSRVGALDRDFALADRILDWALANLYDAGTRRFVYQRHRWYVNRVDYLRWTQAWAYYGLTVYESERAKKLGGAS
ncbi:hypothetical protein D8I24_7942 [Cupriavidus necator H850]|uniref:aspartate-semialdehyde dehydrogenase n=1 Tax=Cupriavidus necator TaxID=106590 RepID=UPI00129D79B3|nr:aspartate-semialdehyde dehydrogenase [Cupriavidus necator]KAI3595321.1 hypothetical protein D8I24_7942 [Cupriavidus necator H850]